MAKTRKTGRNGYIWGLAGAIIGVCVPLGLVYVANLVPADTIPFLSPEAGKLLLSRLFVPIHWPLKVKLSANLAWDDPSTIRRAQLCPIINLGLYAIAGGILGLLTAKLMPARNPTERDAAEFLWYKTTFGRLMIAGPFMSLVIPLGLLWIENTAQHLCDRSAEKVARNTFMHLERLDYEAKDLGCQSLRAHLSEEQLKFTVGTHYGWAGTWTKHERCGILLSIDSRVVRTCAMRGTHPTQNPRDRHIFIIPKVVGEAVTKPEWEFESPDEKAARLQASRVGPCTGKAYGYGATSSLEEAPIYAESILDRDSCQFRVPQTYYELFQRHK